MRPISICVVFAVALIFYDCQERDDSTAMPAVTSVPGALPPAPAETISLSTVDASELLVRSGPDRSKTALAKLDRGEVVEIVEEAGDELEIDGMRGRWTKVRAIVVEKDRPRFLEGWVFGGYLEKGGDGQYGTAQAADDLSPFRKIVPASAAFDVTNRIFSVGTGCSGSTYSEYEHIVRVRGDAADLIYASFEHGGGGEDGACSVEFTETQTGSYSVDGNRLRLRVRKSLRREALFDSGMETEDGRKPDCSGTNESKRDVAIDLEYVLVYCYEYGRTVPGLLQVGDENREFWAMREQRL